MQCDKCNLNKHDTRAGVAELMLGDCRVRKADFWWYFISFFFTATAIATANAAVTASATITATANIYLI